jgi:hypothetical protein
MVTLLQTTPGPFTPHLPHPRADCRRLDQANDPPLARTLQPTPAHTTEALPLGEGLARTEEAPMVP